MITVLIVDDHAGFRDALVGLVERETDLEVVGVAGDGAAAVALARHLGPDVVVMDLLLPGLDGVSAAAQVVASGASTRVLGISTRADRIVVELLVVAGASGFVTKFEEPGVLVSAIRTVGGGGTCFPDG